MAKTKQERFQSVFDVARREFNSAVAATQDQRIVSLQDRRFAHIPGAQWEDASYVRAFENRPKLEMNKTRAAVMRVINEYLSNRITVDFVPKTGADADELADLCDGLYRADEADSRAQEAYALAYQEAVSGGFGAFRLVTEYEDEYDEEGDDQRIRFEPIPDADQCVYFDPNAKRKDKSDARFCFVLTFYSTDAYKEEFGDDPQGWPKPSVSENFLWSTPEGVYVAEYFRVEDQRYKVTKLRTIDGEESTVPSDELDEDEALRLMAVGTKVIGEKTVKRRRIRKYLLSGGGILEDMGHIAGTCIPVVPVYGSHMIVDGAEHWSGVVRYVKDPQRLYNMQVSMIAEMSARGSVEKPIFAPEQVAGHEYLWETDAVENYAYMLVNPVRNAQGEQVFQGALDYTRPPSVPPATAALIPLVDQDIKDILGNQQAGEEIDAQLSGKAVELIQTRLDQQNVIYMSNFADALRRAGEIWLGMAKEVYVEEGRSMKWIGASEEVDTVEINQDAVFSDGKVVRKNDLSRAKMEVAVDVGPTSSSKRSATARALSSMLQFVADAQDQVVLTAAIMMNIEGEGLSSVNKYFRRKLVQMGVEEPTEEEQQEMAMAQGEASQPDPQTLALIQGVDAQAQRDLAAARESEADAEEARARTAKLQAETIATLADVDNNRVSTAVKAASDLRQAGTMPPQSGMS